MNEYKKKKLFQPVKIYKEDHDRLLKKSWTLSAIEGKKVSVPELIRRTFNIPNLDVVLVQDATKKRLERR